MTYFHLLQMYFHHKHLSFIATCYPRPLPLQTSNQPTLCNKYMSLILIVWHFPQKDQSVCLTENERRFLNIWHTWLLTFVLVGFIININNVRWPLAWCAIIDFIKPSISLIDLWRISPASEAPVPSVKYLREITWGLWMIVHNKLCRWRRSKSWVTFWATHFFHLVSTGFLDCRCR